jgi:hypothetical protein
VALDPEARAKAIEILARMIAQTLATSTQPPRLCLSSTIQCGTSRAQSRTDRAPIRLGRQGGRSRMAGAAGSGDR